MATMEDTIGEAFSARPDLRKRVVDAINVSPIHANLFTSISGYILELRDSISNGAAAAEGPATKKRRVDGDALPTRSNKYAALWNPKGRYDTLIEDVSFSIPVRKKFDALAFVGGDGGGLKVAQGGETQYAMGWDQIDQIFLLPIPEKPKRQWNFVVIPKGNDGLSSTPASPLEQWLWTFSEPSKKELEAGAPADPSHYVTLLNKHLSTHGKKVVEPRKEVFKSAIPQSNRKGEPAFHVKAFRGSKEGYLFFTDVGLVFGFKKPILFFSLGTIESISYESILQRTFNLVIQTFSDLGDGYLGEKFEFSMMDQADHPGVDEYLNSRGLKNSSLSKERRAQFYGVNVPKEERKENGAVAAGAEGDEMMEEEEGELQKAERMLQDQEDDEEEDYDPGSEGESEGSGSSSEEEEEYEEGGGDEGDEEEEGDEDDLVRKELGSDAEDVGEDED